MFILGTYYGHVLELEVHWTFTTGSTTDIHVGTSNRHPFQSISIFLNPFSISEGSIQRSRFIFIKTREDLDAKV